MARADAEHRRAALQVHAQCVLLGHVRSGVLPDAPRPDLDPESRGHFIFHGDEPRLLGADRRLASHPGAAPRSQRRTDVAALFGIRLPRLGLRHQPAARVRAADHLVRHHVFHDRPPPRHDALPFVYGHPPARELRRHRPRHGALGLIEVARARGADRTRRLGALPHVLGLLPQRGVDPDLSAMAQVHLLRAVLIPGALGERVPRRDLLVRARRRPGLHPEGRHRAQAARLRRRPHRRQRLHPRRHDSRLQRARLAHLHLEQAKVPALRGETPTRRRRGGPGGAEQQRRWLWRPRSLGGVVDVAEGRRRGIKRSTRPSR
mmetsp:Transcript_9043/g.37226  ORF Transcript_9043/g.37226 Transcript_9043/m.37226 type:complete len:319 (-) Transcript_9043:57-1013(-)